MELSFLYEYDEIQPHQIRLCRFVREKDSVSAVLKTFSADTPFPDYTALSYTWSLDHSGPTKNQSIQIGEQRLPTLDSLQPFFQALRSKQTLLDDTWWWIDSICINQTNVPERSSHVRRMKEIYEGAHNVIVWLGEPSDDSDSAIDFVQLLYDVSLSSHNDQERRAILQNDQYQPQWIAFRNLFLRKWWTRIWTIQEFVTPSDLSFWCGERSISRTAVCGALWVADRSNSTGFKDTIAFHHAWNRRRAWVLHSIFNKPGRDFAPSLLSLAAYFCSNEATDDRDRLYGLYAISRRSHDFEINYSLSVDDVYLKFAQSFIKNHKSLDIISFASLFRASPGSFLPSWVPDWRHRLEPLVVPLMVSESSKSHIGNLRSPMTFEYADKTVRYSASQSTEAIYMFEGQALLARGSIIDAVDGLAGTQTLNFVQSSDSQLPQDTDSQRSSVDIITAICRCLALDSKDRYLRYPMPMKEFYHDFYQLCLLALAGSSQSITKEFYQWFERVRSLRIRGTSLENILLQHYQSKVDLDVHDIPKQDEYVQDSFYGRFFDTVERMSLRLMTSFTGRIGMVPERAMKGDSVCLLYGCSVPMLLRRSQDDDSFTLVGECFLDGCMAGEALAQSDLMERTFRII